MATDPEVLSVQRWAVGVTAVNSIVTAIVAVAVSRHSHYFTDLRERRKEAAQAEQNRRERLREKLETLVSLLFEYVEVQQNHGLYIGTLGIYTATGKDAPDEPVRPGLPPKANADMLARLYFPDLSKLMLGVTSAAVPLHNFWSKEMALMASDVQAWKRDSQPTFGTRNADLVAAIDRAVSAVADAARKKIEELGSEQPPPEPAPGFIERVRGWFATP